MARCPDRRESPDGPVGCLRLLGLNPRRKSGRRYAPLFTGVEAGGCRLKSTRPLSQELESLRRTTLQVPVSVSGRGRVPLGEEALGLLEVAWALPVGQ